MQGLPSSSRSEVLGWYRLLLRHAKVFPSIKRKELYDNIRLGACWVAVWCGAGHILCAFAEFRDCKAETDPKKLAIMHEKAVRGINQMSKYTNLDPRAHQWSVDLEKDPLGPGRV